MLWQSESGSDFFGLSFYYLFYTCSFLIPSSSWYGSPDLISLIRLLFVRDGVGIVALVYTAGCACVGFY
jgi:hypothetical protein